MSAPLSTASATRTAPDPSFPEFVGIIAACMALGALAIDAMLPALPIMGREFQVVDHNHLQWIVAAFFIGNGAGQVVFGPLSDWIGRKPVLIGGIVLYMLLSVAAAFVSTLWAMILLRALQGVASSAGNVVARACVRDRYVGARMAKVMSTTYVVFLLVPVLAPSLGQAMLLVAPWQWIFLMLGGMAALVAGWVWLRLPETQNPVDRRRPDIGHLKRTAIYVLTEPASQIYTAVITLLIATLLTYISLVPQIFEDVFHKPHLLGPIFAACAATMGAASLLNARLVERLGSRRIGLWALIAFVAVSAIHFVWAWFGLETLWSFTILQSLTMGAMILCTSNFAALAMEKMGHVAGTAASIQGVITAVGGAMVGAWVGQHWSGHIWLMPLGAFLCGLVGLVLVRLGRARLKAA